MLEIKGHGGMIVHPEFKDIVNKLEPLLEELQNSSPHTVEEGLGHLTNKGVYAFYEKGEPIYIGRSNRMKARIREHGAESSRHGSATFAYKLLLEAKGESGGHSSARTRKNFQEAKSSEYRRQRQRIREMEVRAVGIENQQVQAVFEICAILDLGTTKYNSFQTT